MQKDKRPTEVRTPEFRVSYPSVFKPKYNELGKKYEYIVQARFPKDTTDLKPFKEAIKAAAIDRWGSLEKVPKKAKMPIKDGDEMDDPQCEGHWVMDFKASENYQPAVVSTKKDQSGKFTPITSEKEFYGGCYARAVVNAYAYDVEVNKGVNFGLGNIQKLRDGDRFGGGSAVAEEDFSDTPDTPEETGTEDAPW